MDKRLNDVVRSIRGQFPDLTLKEIDKVVKAFLEQVKDEVIEGNTVSLYSFGKFKPVQSRREIHFNTHEDQYEDRVVEYTKISFRSSSSWKDEINGRD